MASSLDQEALLNRDLPVPINIMSLLQLLESRNDEFSTRLVDVLRQLNYAIHTIWRTLKLVPEEVSDIELYSPTGEVSAAMYPSALMVADEANTANRLDITPTTINVVNGDENLSILCGGDQVYIGLTRNGNLDMWLTTGSSGVNLNMASGAEIRINGVKVLTNRQATVAAITGTAGGAYTATEQAMINNLKTGVNDLISRLQGMGIIA